MKAQDDGKRKYHHHNAFVPFKVHIEGLNDYSLTQNFCEKTALVKTLPY